MRRLFSNIHNRKIRSRIRRKIRNSKKIQLEKGEDVFVNLRHVLFQTELDPKYSGSAKNLMPEPVELSEVTVRQLLNKRCHYLNLQSAILDNPMNLSFAMPPEWQEVIIKHGFSIDKTKTNFLWFWLLIRLLVYAIFIAAKEVWFCHKTKQKQNPSHLHQFVRLPKNWVSYPSQENGKNIIDWYRNQIVNDTENLRVAHDAGPHPIIKYANVEIEGARHFHPQLNIKAGVRLLIWTLANAVSSLRDLSRGRWWSALLLHEAVIANKIYLANREALAERYLFSHEFCIYKPLWVDVAEKLGSEAWIYFYSTNSIGPASKSGINEIFPAFLYMNWTNYMVWSHKHKEQLLKFCVKNPSVSKKNFTVVGPIPTIYGQKLLKKTFRPAIAVFDVSPARLSFYCGLGMNNELFASKNVRKFLLTIEEVRVNLGLPVYLKLKRKTSQIHDKSYLSLVEKLKNSGWQIIDPETNPRELLTQTDVSIHYPFTSTAILAEDLGQPAVYLDPTAEIQASDRGILAGHLISSVEQLENFIKDVLPR